MKKPEGEAHCIGSQGLVSITSAQGTLLKASHMAKAEVREKCTFVGVAKSSTAKGVDTGKGEGVNNFLYQRRDFKTQVRVRCHLHVHHTDT